jgi:hypothetical protein
MSLARLRQGQHMGGVLHLAVRDALRAKISPFCRVGNTFYGGRYIYPSPFSLIMGLNPEGCFFS